MSTADEGDDDSSIVPGMLALTGVFALLKLTVWPSLTWAMVLCPIWAPPILSVFLLATFLAALMALIVGFIVACVVYSLVQKVVS